MRLLLQRVSKASVSVSGREVSEIGNGLLVFVGFRHGDTLETVERAKEKIVNLRIFEDEKGKMNKNVTEVSGEMLIVSQFTLYADAKKGNRPSFDQAMEGSQALNLFDSFCETVSRSVHAGKGEFGEIMDVSLINHGPATFMLEIE